MVEGRCRWDCHCQVGLSCASALQDEVNKGQHQQEHPTTTSRSPEKWQVSAGWCWGWCAMCLGCAGVGNTHIAAVAAVAVATVGREKEVGAQEK